MKTKNKTKYILPTLAVLFLLAGCRSADPVIFSIYPSIGIMGEPITILGSSFGDERDASFVTIAGAQPTGTAYLEWSDNRIRLRIPELGEAGLVFVHVGGRRSNGVIFVNEAALPRTVDGRTGLGPMVSTVMPHAGAIGSIVTITGSGFGNSRGSGGVFFSRNAQGAWAAGQDFIEVSEAEFGYELWTDREIRVRVPDGAVSGNMEVRTARGRSSPLVFEVNGSPGTKDFVDRRSYIITYSVNIRTGIAEAPNTLHLWVPFPAVSAAQRNVEMLFSNPAPFILDYFGTSLYRLDNLEAHSSTDVSMSWTVDVYGIRTSVQPQEIRREAISPMRDAHTRGGPNLPADDPRIMNLAMSIIAGETNPYQQARRIYDWMLGGNIVWDARVQGDIFSVLETGRADTFLAALLYSTLLRAVGIPSQPVAGVLVGRDRQTMNHYWAEFWIDGLGWIPVDPAMGAAVTGTGAIPANFVPPVADAYDDAAAFYFGNIDSWRIAFSRGFTDISQLDPRGRTITQVRSYALQTLWEEVIGGIESYYSLWGNIIITGIHAQ
ncbi:MAG: IPT/TIG domain-containing protein [Treponema sp.]|nr:IPT/TIG domain-containing protein [Treponema sp.]